MFLFSFTITENRYRLTCTSPITPIAPLRRLKFLYANSPTSASFRRPNTNARSPRSSQSEWTNDNLVSFNVRNARGILEHNSGLCWMLNDIWLNPKLRFVLCDRRSSSLTPSFFSTLSVSTSPKHPTHMCLYNFQIFLISSHKTKRPRSIKRNFAHYVYKPIRNSCVHQRQPDRPRIHTIQGVDRQTTVDKQQRQTRIGTWRAAEARGHQFGVQHNVSTQLNIIRYLLIKSSKLF